MFGSIAYLHTPKEIVGGKFESRSKKCYMMGYCPNGYRLWCPEDRKLLFGRDVIFDETKFTVEAENFYDKSLPNQTEMHDQGGDAQNSRDNDDTRNPSRVLTDDHSDETSDAGSEEEIPQKQGDNEGLRRSARTRRKPNHLDNYCAIALSAENFLDEVPESLSEIDNRKNKDHWKKAVQNEIDSLLKDVGSGKIAAWKESD